MDIQYRIKKLIKTYEFQFLASPEPICDAV